jgi:pSer/pThr/pTyr-binding forkhead associated (FHA) protein
MLGAVGFVVGDFPPYPTVVLVCLSIAYGCFGLVVGTLLNDWVEPAPAAPHPCADVTEQPSTERHNLATAVSEVHLASLQPAAGEPVVGPDTLVVRSFPCVIGRHPTCDHLLDCTFISRRHCVFSLRDGRVWVHDLNSRHGTHLNGAAITGVQPLTDDDRLEIGPVPFRVCLVRKPDKPGDH